MHLLTRTLTYYDIGTYCIISTDGLISKINTYYTNKSNKILKNAPPNIVFSSLILINETDRYCAKSIIKIKIPA